MAGCRLLPQPLVATAVPGAIGEEGNSGRPHGRRCTVARSEARTDGAGQSDRMNETGMPWLDRAESADAACEPIGISNPFISANLRALRGQMIRLLKWWRHAEARPFRGA